jgi:hypothetical protein
LELLTRYVNFSFDLFKSRRYDAIMPKQSVRTSLDVPVALHRRLKQIAARRGCSARQLILQSIERAVEELEVQRPPRRLSLDPPIIPSLGNGPIDVTNEQIYKLIEFP